MATLADVYERLNEMGVEPDEITIPRRVIDYLIQIAQDILEEEADNGDD